MTLLKLQLLKRIDFGRCKNIANVFFLLVHVSCSSQQDFSGCEEKAKERKGFLKKVSLRLASFATETNQLVESFATALSLSLSLSLFLSLFLSPPLFSLSLSLSLSLFLFLSLSLSNSQSRLNW
jgi:hypothetical protein